MEITTVDIDDGVTPAMMRCRSGKKCNGMMYSFGYTHIDQTSKPEYEWFNPPAMESARRLLNHGSLSIRPITDETLASLGFTNG